MRKQTADALAEWLNALDAAASKKADAGMTVAEMSAVTGRNVHRIKELLKAARDAGRLTVGQRPYVRLDGRPCLIPVYTVLPEPVGRTKTEKRKSA